MYNLVLVYFYILNRAAYSICTFTADDNLVTHFQIEIFVTIFTTSTLKKRTVFMVFRHFLTKSTSKKRYTNYKFPNLTICSSRYYWRVAHAPAPVNGWFILICSHGVLFQEWHWSKKWLFLYATCSLYSIWAMASFWSPDCVFAKTPFTLARPK